jgi:hypothetical protein
MHRVEFEETLPLETGEVTIRHERIGASEYIAFLATTGLGQQYPAEDFVERVSTLVNNVQISLVARNPAGSVVAICFGLTDFAYWLFLTDLGVARTHERLGLGKRLMTIAHELAGGEERVVQFCYAEPDDPALGQSLVERPRARLGWLSRLAGAQRAHRQARRSQRIGGDSVGGSGRGAPTSRASPLSLRSAFGSGSGARIARSISAFGGRSARLAGSFACSTEGPVTCRYCAAPTAGLGMPPFGVRNT